MLTKTGKKADEIWYFDCSLVKKNVRHGCVSDIFFVVCSGICLPCVAASYSAAGASASASASASAFAACASASILA